MTWATTARRTSQTWATDNLEGQKNLDNHTQEDITDLSNFANLDSQNDLDDQTQEVHTILGNLSNLNDQEDHTDQEDLADLVIHCLSRFLHCTQNLLQIKNRM